jgi:hypothetical protein
MPTAYSFRTNPLSRIAATAGVTTDGEKFLVNRDARVARITTDAAAYVGVGNSATVPAAAVGNTANHASGTEDYVLNMPGSQSTYIYVYSVAATITVTVSFLG